MKLTLAKPPDCYVARKVELFNSFSSCYSLELCIQMCVFFLFSSALYFSSFLSFLDNHFAFLHFFFLRLVLITASCSMSQTSVHRSSSFLSLQCNPLNLLYTSIV